MVVGVNQLLDLTHFWYMLVRLFGLLRSLLLLLTHLLDALTNGLDCLDNFLFDLVKSTQLPLDLLTKRLSSGILVCCQHKDVVEP